MHFHVQSIKAGPMMIACKTGKLFAFFSDQLNVNVHVAEVFATCQLIAKTFGRRGLLIIVTTYLWMMDECVVQQKQATPTLTRDIVSL